MLSRDEVAHRNKWLISLIKALDLGIHVVSRGDQPKFISPDYKRRLSGYVKNFNLLLMKGPFTDEVFLKIQLRPLADMNLDELKKGFIHWLKNYKHNTVYTIRLKENGLFLIGFDYHNKVNRTEPFPVFAKFNPMLFYTLTKAREESDKYEGYDLEIH